MAYIVMASTCRGSRRRSLWQIGKVMRSPPETATSGVKWLPWYSSASGVASASALWRSGRYRPAPSDNHIDA